MKELGSTCDEHRTLETQDMRYTGSLLIKIRSDELIKKPRTTSLEYLCVCVRACVRACVCVLCKNVLYIITFQ